MNIVDLIKRNIQDRGLSCTPSGDIQSLEDGIGFRLDDAIKVMLTEIGSAKLSKGRILFGVGTEVPSHDIYQRYLTYTDTLRFFPRNSLPVLWLDTYNILVYDCEQRKVMIVATSDEGVIRYTFDGGLLEVINGYV